MTHCLTRLKNGLSPIVQKATRWSGKCSLLERFGRIIDELIQVADTEGVNPSWSSARGHHNCLRFAAYPYVETSGTTDQPIVPVETVVHLRDRRAAPPLIGIRINTSFVVSPFFVIQSSTMSLGIGFPPRV